MSRYKAVIACLVLACIAVWTAVALLPDKNLHIYFCDVGQGDGILITHLDMQLLVDTGPDNSILDCLAENIPFYDKRIEMIIITHPQQDHMGGLKDVVERYTVLQLVSVRANANIRSYQWLVDAWKNNVISVTNVYAHDDIIFGPMHFKVIWPTRDFIAEHTQGTKVLGATTDGTDLNSFAVVGILTFGDFDLLLTGDADEPVLLAEIATGLLRNVEVLKVPHHGSKTGMTPAWLEAVKPQFAVISAGKNNRYGHPTKEALTMLEQTGSQVLRTDLSGTIEIVSDGKHWWVAK